MGCKILNHYISTNLNIKQGIYLTAQDLQKIQIGLTKSEIFSNIGYPILQDLFEKNKWYYVYYHYYSHNHTQHQTLALTFDSNDILICISNL